MGRKRYNENDMTEAIEAYQRKEFNTYSECAKHFHLDQATLRRHILNPKGPGSGGHNKALSDELEKALCLYCDRCILLGRPPKKKHLRAESWCTTKSFTRLGISMV